MVMEQEGGHRAECTLCRLGYLLLWDRRFFCAGAALKTPSERGSIAGDLTALARCDQFTALVSACVCSHLGSSGSHTSAFPRLSSMLRLRAAVLHWCCLKRLGLRPIAILHTQLLFDYV